MSETTRLVNLSAEANRRGLQITIDRRMAVDMKTGDLRGCWAASVGSMTVTARGRLGKAREVMALIAGDDQGPADLLRQLADLYEYGDVPVSR